MSPSWLRSIFRNQSGPAAGSRPRSAAVDPDKPCPCPRRPGREPATGDRDLKVIWYFVRRNTPVMIGVPRHHTVDRAHHLAGTKPAVAVEVNDTEDRAPLVVGREQKTRACSLDLAIGKRHELVQVKLAVSILVNQFRQPRQGRCGPVSAVSSLPSR